LRHRRSVSASVDAQVSSPVGLSEFLDRIESELQVAGCERALANRILLVIEELVVNAFDHGRAEAVRTTVNLNDDGADLAISHDGPAFDTSAADNVPPLDPHAGGGLGLRIVHHLARPLSYERQGGLNLTRAAVR